MSQKIINKLLEAAQEDTTNPFPHFALAKEYQKVNDLVSAENHFRHLINNFPEYGGTYYHFALFLIEKDQPEEAIEIINAGLPVLQSAGETNLYKELAGLKHEYFE